MDKNVVLARKYGRAIYEIAAEQNSLEKTGEELHLIADTITGNAELKQLLFHPLLAKDVKKDTLNKLFADKVQPVSSAVLLCRHRQRPFHRFPGNGRRLCGSG